MKTQIKWSLLAAAVVALGACYSSQPTPPCAVGHGGYSAKFTLKTGSCTGTGCETAPSATSGSCIRSGDIIGVDKYRQTDGTQMVWLRAEPLVEELFGNTGTTTFGDVEPGVGKGQLASPVRDAENFCNVPSVSDMSGTNLLGQDLTYKFSNVKFYMTGAVPGTQFHADLTIAGTDCSADYSVDALYPVVWCPELDADGNPTGGPDLTPTTPPETPPAQAHVNACDAPDQWWSYVQANPVFSMTCAPAGNMAREWDPATGEDIFGVTAPRFLCVPKTAVPSVK